MWFCLGIVSTATPAEFPFALGMFPICSLCEYLILVIDLQLGLNKPLKLAAKPSPGEEL